MTLRQDALFDDTTSGAVINGPYRYTLWRTWAARPTLCGWVMLNPSTADADVDDPTIRRCVGYARRWGFGGIVVRNLFALRATDPRTLLAATDPVGPDNDMWLSERWDDIGRVVVAWGTGRYPRLGGRWEQVAALLKPLRPVCLRVARDGQPVHPLYQPGGLEPSPWRPAAENGSAESHGEPRTRPTPPPDTRPDPNGTPRPAQQRARHDQQRTCA